MILVRKSNTPRMCLLYVVLLLFISPIFIWSESEWEGTAAVGRYGEFPVSGYYAASNAFPRNTTLVVENLETGLTSSVIVVDRLSQAGLFILLSRDAARELGLAENDIAAVRVVIREDSSDSRTVPDDDMAVSADPDQNPSVSVSGIPGLEFLEEYVSGDLPVTDTEPEPLLPPLDEMPSEEESVKEIVEEIPPEPVLTMDNLETRILAASDKDFSITDVPDTPETDGGEVVLTGFDSDPLIVPRLRRVGTAVAVAPEVPEKTDEIDISPAEKTAESVLLEYAEIPRIPYPPERVVASAFEAPREPFFETPEILEEEPSTAAEAPRGPYTEMIAMAAVPVSRSVSLGLVAVPEEPAFESDKVPTATDYLAPASVPLEIAYTDVPAEPEPDIPEITGDYLVEETSADEYTISEAPVPPTEEELPEVEERDTLAFTEPEVEEVELLVEVVPEVVTEEEPEEPIEVAEGLPEPDEVDVFLEPAEPRPPEPIEEAAPEEELPVEEPEYVAVIPVGPGSRTAAGNIEVSASLRPSSHYLQLGVFSEEGTAQVAAARIRSGYPITILKAESTAGTRYKLLIGPLSPDESGALLYQFKLSGYRDAFVRVAN